jgi:carboxyl-terminal processing protease
MKRFSAIVLPGLILTAAVFTGGWLLQRGVDQERSSYSQVRLFDEVLSHVQSNFVDPVEQSTLYESAIQGLLEELGDPHTSFMPASMVDDFQIRMEGEYGGVGLEVVPRDGWVTVTTALPGSPGTRAGIRVGDQIWEVDGVTMEGWDDEDVVNLLRGRPGTDVSVGIRRPGVDELLPFTITRANIQLKSVPFALLLEEGIGYLPIQAVSETSFQEMRQGVDSLQALGMTELILDLRANPGGTLEQGIQISDFFLDPGQGVVDTRGRAPNQTESYSAFNPQAYPDLSVVVLVDERSASASEIIAGAIQDHDRGIVLGAPTFGKGSVQSLFPLTGGNILKLTTARWYTPLGRSISKAREDQIAAMENSTLTVAGWLASRPDSAPKPVFHTRGGRVVYGGGGIVPDVLVMADTLTAVEQEAITELERSGGVFMRVVFNFAVRYLQEHPNLEEGFSLSPQDLAAFRQELWEAGAEMSAGAARQAERFLSYQLEREIALQAWGEVGAFRQGLVDDRALQRALALFRNSSTPAELMELAGGGASSDWIPVLGEEAAQGAVASAAEGVGGGTPGSETRNDTGGPLKS